MEQNRDEIGCEDIVGISLVRTLTLTCLVCRCPNIRRLPYDMGAPDRCSWCKVPFNRGPREEGCSAPTTGRKGDWIQTFSGGRYWPADPRPEDINATDVAHHLAMLCRYCGACERFYSVAEHSVHVSYVVETYLRHTMAEASHALNYEEAIRALTFRALLHDGPEAYIHDITRPLKNDLPGYKEIERRNWSAMCVAFHLNTPDSSGLIKHADNAMLLAEQAAIMKPAPHAWEPLDVPPLMLEAAHARLANEPYGWGPNKAKRMFMARFAQLQEPA